MRPWIQFVLVVLVVARPGSLLAAPLVMDRPAGLLEPGPYTAYIEDLTNHLDPETVFELPAAAWTRAESRQFAFSSAEHAVWLRLDVRNESENPDWVLESQFPFLELVDLYVRSEGQTLKTQRSGLQVAFHQQPMHTRGQAFPLQLEPGREYQIYLRLSGRVAKVVQLAVMDPQTTTSREFNDVAVYIALLIFLFCMVVWNLVLAVALRDSTSVLYAVFLSVFGAYQAVLAGLVYVWFLPDEPEWNLRLIFLTGLGSAILLIIFWKKLLMLRLHVPRLNWIFTVFVGVYSVLWIYSLSPSPDYALLDNTAKPLFFLFTLAGIVTCFRILRLGYRPALYSGIGLTLLMVCVSIFFGWSIGLIRHPLGRYALLIGTIIEVSFFFIALGSRLRLLSATDGIRLDQLSAPERTATYEAHFSDQSPVRDKLAGHDAEDIMQRLHHMMEHERLYCDEDLSVARLAQLLEIQPYVLSLIINQKFQAGFFRFINDYRIKEAGTLLRNEPERPVQSVLSAVGFSSKSSFHKEFKRVYACTPREWREGMRSP